MTRRRALLPSEYDVLQLAAMGLSYRKIAAARGVSLATVRNQLEMARHALGASNTIQCFVIMGWLVVPPHHAEDGTTDPA